MPRLWHSQGEGDFTPLLSWLENKAVQRGLVLSQTEFLSGPLALIDNGDCQIAEQGKSLLRLSHKLLSISQRDIYPLHRKDQPPFDFPLPPRELCERIEQPPAWLLGLAPLRNLQILARGKGRYQQWRLTNRLHKTCGIIYLLDIELNGISAQHFCFCQTYRGFTKSEKLLTSWQRYIKDVFPGQTAGVSEIVALYRRHPLVVHHANTSMQKGRPDIASQTKRWLKPLLLAAFSNEQGIILDIDTEYLHQYRVNMRKARSLLSLCKGTFEENQQQHCANQLANWMQNTNVLRDLDVHLQDLVTYQQILPPHLHCQADKLRHNLQKERQIAQQRLSDQLQSTAYQTNKQILMQSIAQLNDGDKGHKPATQYGRKRLIRQLNKIFVLTGQLHDQSPDDELHRLRIALKKARYLAEFFQRPKTTKRLSVLASSLKQLTQDFGLFNDACVQQQALHGWLDSARAIKRPPSEYIEALTLLLRYYQEQKRQTKYKISQHLRLLNDPNHQSALLAATQNLI